MSSLSTYSDYSVYVRKCGVTDDRMQVKIAMRKYLVTTAHLFRKAAVTKLRNKHAFPRCRFDTNTRKKTSFRGQIYFKDNTQIDTEVIPYTNSRQVDRYIFQR